MAAAVAGVHGLNGCCELLRTVSTAITSTTKFVLWPQSQVRPQLYCRPRRLRTFFWATGRHISCESDLICVLNTRTDADRAGNPHFRHKHRGNAGRIAVRSSKFSCRTIFNALGLAPSDCPSCAHTCSHIDRSRATSKIYSTTLCERSIR
eukprot:SAG31_NODE_2766_length_5123_cov_3.395900_4_plen_150_part_00